MKRPTDSTTIAKAAFVICFSEIESSDWINGTQYWSSKQDRAEYVQYDCKVFITNFLFTSGG